MRKAHPVLATAAEIRRIAGRAEALIDAVLSRDEEEEDLIDYREERARENARLHAGIEALRFCAVAAGELGDPELVPVVVQAIEICQRFDDHSDDNVTTLGLGLTLLLEAGAPVDEDIKRLAKDHDARLREAVAEGLRPRGEAEIALLDALSTDGIAEVRNAAKKKLANVREVAWWKGKFKSDPLARLTAIEAERHKVTFERLSSLLDLARYYLPKHEAELVELAGALPDPLAVEVAEMILAAPDPYATRLPSLGTMMLGRPGGVAAFIQVCEALGKQHARYISGKELAQMFLPLPAELRVAACKELAAYAVSLPDEVRLEQTGNAARIVGETIAKVWPPGEDPTPLLDALLTLSPAEGHAIDWVASSMDDVFTEEGADPAPILERVVEAHLADYPGSWRNIRGAMHTVLTRAPGAVIRGAAEQSILRDDEGSVRWGIERLLANAHDPARDPPLAEMTARLYAEPRYRKVITSSFTLRNFATPLLRADLREGRLDFPEAAVAMTAIGSLYGAVAHATHVPRLYDLGLDLEQHRRAEAAKLDAFLGPPELRGPPTDEEWRALRAARAAYLATEGHDPEEIFNALPEGPWHPEDRAALESVVRAFRAGDHDLTVAIALALAAKPEEIDLPLLDELIKAGDPDETPLLRQCRAHAMRELGLEPKGTTENEGQDDEDDEEAWPGEGEDED